MNTNSQWQVETGFNLKLGETWTGEFYYSHGQSQTYNNANGNLSLQRFRAVMQAPDWGRNASAPGQPRPACGRTSAPRRRTARAASTTRCLHGDQPLSHDCYNAINAQLQTRAQNKQDIIEVNFQGVLAKLKPGELRAAFGYQSRDNSASFVPDILQSTFSFTDQVIGVYPTGYLDAHTSADDLYLETLVPLLADHKGVPQARARARRSLLQVRPGRHRQRDDVEGARQLGDQRLVPLPRRLQPRDARAEPRRAVPESAGDLRGRRQRLRRSLRCALDRAVRRGRQRPGSGADDRRAGADAGPGPDGRGRAEREADLPGDDGHGRREPVLQRRQRDARRADRCSTGSTRSATRISRRKSRTPARYGFVINPPFKSPLLLRHQPDARLLQDRHRQRDLADLGRQRELQLRRQGARDHRG